MDLQDLVSALLGVLAAIPAAYWSAKKRVEAELHKRLDKISGGAVQTIEDLVAVATREYRIRSETSLAVYGGEDLWSELRRSGFEGARLHERAESPVVAVVDVSRTTEEVIASLQEPYLLLYATGDRYKGKLPPAYVTYANSELTLDARLMELLRHREARKAT